MPGAYVGAFEGSAVGATDGSSVGGPVADGAGVVPPGLVGTLDGDTDGATVVPPAKHRSSPKTSVVPNGAMLGVFFARKRSQTQNFTHARELSAFLFGVAESAASQKVCRKKL